MISRFRGAFLISALLALLMVGGVFAGVITVDGQPSDWDLSMNETFPPIDLEDYPDSVDLSVDIAEYWATNDSTNVYYRIDTWTNTDWNNIQSFAVCMDVDPAVNSGCGPTWGCDSDADYALVIDPLFATTKLVDASTCANVPGAAPSASSDTFVTEVSIPLAALGLSGSNCAPCYIGTQIIMQYGFTLSDADVFPDTGYYLQMVGEGSPTSLDLVSFSAGSLKEESQLYLATAVTLAAVVVMLVVAAAWRRALSYPK